MYADQDYKKGNFLMPDFENTSIEEKKTKKFALSVGKWLYHQHINDKMAIPNTLESYYQLVRLYGEGRQPKEIYEKSPRVNNSTDPLDMYDRDVKRKGLSNQNDKIVSLMPKFKSILLAILKNLDFDVQCNTVDPSSGSEEEENMMRVWMRSLYGGRIDNISLQNGLPITNDEIFPEDSQDLKQLRMEGMFKPEHAIEIEEVTKHVLNISKWDEQLSERFSNETLDTGWITGYSSYDFEDKSEKAYFSYPENTIKQHSKSRMYEDSDFEGVCIDYPISTLRLIFPDVPQVQWMTYARKFQGYNGNPVIADFSNWTTSYHGLGTPYDEFNIPVLIFNWVDVEKKKKVRHTTKKGKKVTLDFDKTKEALHKPENIFTHRRRVKYGGKWVIGSEDLCWDYGPYPNQPHKMTRPMSSVFAYKFPYESLTIRAIPLMDDLQFAWKKYNDAMAKAFPGGLAINISMLNNISDGKEGEQTGKIHWSKSIANMYNTGILAYMDNPINIHTTASKGGIPIMEIPSTVLKSLNEYLSVINQIVLLFETFTGFSPVFLGGTPTDKQAVKNTQLSYSSTLKSLQHIVDGKGLFKQAMAEYIAERMRILFYVDEDVRKVYESVIGKEGVELIRMAKKREAQYGIKMVARPTDEEKQAVIEQANLSYQAHQQGQPGLNEGQRTRIIFMVNNGSNLENVSRFMDMWVRKDRKEKELEKARANQLQSQEVMKQDQNRAAIKSQEIKMEHDSKIALNNNENENKIKLRKVDGEETRKTELAKRNSEYKNLLREQINAGTTKSRI